MKHWDGGFVICGITGSGETFAIRDPWGIRPAYYYTDDEIAVVASERPVIQTVMQVDIADIHELQPGQSFIITKNGQIETKQILHQHKKSACSCERI